MWLLLAGLALLTGDVLSQANKVIYSETDLLALPSDQLIDSSAELLAMEDSITGLPFGAKLPGYENPLFAYSYTIKDDDFPDEKSQTIFTVPERLPLSSSHTLSNIYSYNSNTEDSEEDKPQLAKETLKRENFHIGNKSPEKLFGDSASIEDSSHNDGRLTSQKIPNQQILPHRALDSSSDESIPTAPLLTIHETKLHTDSLQPSKQDPPLKSLVLEYLPPRKSAPLKPQKTEPAPQASAALQLKYLPPIKGAPQKPTLNLDYLPPAKDPDPLPQINLDYLPPKDEPSPKPLNLDYLPPKEESPITPSLNIDYLPPPKEPEPLPALNLDYLPPPKEDPPPETISPEYLPPKSEPLPIPKIDLDYLPPTKTQPSKPSLSLDSLPPTQKSPTPLSPFSLDVIPAEESPSLQPIIPKGIIRNLVPPSISVASKKTENDFKISPKRPSIASNQILETRKQFNNEPIHAVSQINEKPPLGIIKGLKEPDFTHARPFKKLKPDATVEHIVHPQPIGIRRQLNKIKPDSVLEERNNPILAKGEYYEVSPHSVVFQHKDEPIRATARQPEVSSPLAIFVQEKTNTIVQPTVRIAKKPERAFQEIKNDPIIPRAGQSNLSPYELIGDKVENSIIVRKKQSDNVPPYSIIAEHVNEPIKPAYKKPKLPTTEFRNPIINQPIIPQSSYTTSSLAVYEEIPRTKLQKYSSESNKLIVESKKSLACLNNDECNEDEICQDGNCIYGCSIAKNVCIGDAICETRHHVPACVCPLMSTARTINTRGFLQFDCTPMMMAASSSNIIERSQGQTSSQFSTFSYGRPLIAPVSSPNRVPLRSTFQNTLIDYPVRAVGSGDPCNPSPCGPNTRCQVNSRGIALCRCIQDYVPDGNTINGCKPQCTSDGDCPDDYECQAQKCRRVCTPGACGFNADCDARNHRAVCSCPDGYQGNPDVRCSRIVPEIRAPPPLPIDPCVPNPCGTNAICRARGERPVCSCPIGYEGSPLTNCIKGECIAHDDCPNHLACQNLRCIDPCVGVCGSGAECTVRNHQPVCSCPRNNIGDPFRSCRRITEQDICNPTPCGENTNCRARSDGGGSLRAVCSCIDNYIGNPLSGCRAECISDRDCSANQHCKDNRCRNPCVGACGDGAYCDVQNHRAVCTCPEFFQGDAYSRGCYAECTTHQECPDHEACFQFRCIDPCEGSCGVGADCKVEDHTPICSCPRGYTGDPFQSCRAFTREDLCRDNPCGTNAECHPGTDRSGNDRPVCTCPTGYIGNPLIACERGECQSHNECPDHEACYAFMCQSPCYFEDKSVCGDNAECTVKNHQPVCSCPRGYDGNPLRSCSIARNARIAGRTFRKL